jgi:hypothetical protein
MVSVLVASATKSASGNSGILNLGLWMGAPDAANFILNVKRIKLTDNPWTCICKPQPIQERLGTISGTLPRWGRRFYFDSSIAVE